jgi:hypothetical protein
MHRKTISKMAVKLSNSPPGSVRYIKTYPGARRKVEKRLTENQRQKYKAMAKDWSEGNLPQKVQYRYARQ